VHLPPVRADRGKPDQRLEPPTSTAAAGLVESEPAGRYTYYRLRPDALASICAHYSDLGERGERSTRRRPCGVSDLNESGR
jgi:hypothetical protein